MPRPASLDRRVPEPELMQDAAQAEAYAATDFSEPHQEVVARFAACFSDFRGGAVLDLGCGTADVTVRFARAFPAARITGVDGAEAMLCCGRRLVQQQELGAQISLEAILLPDAGLEARRFDAVICNSLLHHLADPGVLWRTARACARPGAPIFVMDLLRPESAARAEALVRQHAADAPELLRRDFYRSLLAAYRPQEVRAQLAAADLAGALTVEVISDRHWIASGRRPQTP